MRGLLALSLLVAAPLAAQVRVADLTARAGEVPVRLVGYGLVVGLDGSGDRSFGTAAGAVHTVRSVTNLLRRFNVDVPAEHLRLRNVAAVLVTAELSPHARPGARFDVQVASLGDATSIEGGVLWMTPLVASPDAPAVATAQGPIAVRTDPMMRRAVFARRIGGSSARLDGAGLLEVPLAAPTTASGPPILALRTPDLPMAARIAGAINAAVGEGTAAVTDPGAITLNPPAGATDNLPIWLAAIDTLPVVAPGAAQVVIDARTGLLVAGGAIPVGTAVVSVGGVTVQVGGTAPGTATDGVVAMPEGTTVQQVATGLHALGVRPTDVAAVFEALRTAGALRAPVVVR